MPFVLIEKPRPHVALVTLNRPDRMNSMAFDVMIPLRDALEEVSLDNDTPRVLDASQGASGVGAVLLQVPDDVTVT